MTFANIYNGISQSKHSNRHGVAREWGIIAGVATPQDQRHIWCSVCYQKHFVSDMWNSAQWLWLSWICTLFHINCLENEFFYYNYYYLLFKLKNFCANCTTIINMVCVCVTTSFICMCACVCGRRWPHVIIVLQSKNKVRLMAQCPLIHMYMCVHIHIHGVCVRQS